MTDDVVLEMEWQQDGGELQVVVWGRFLAAQKRQMHVSYHIDHTLKLITLHCQVTFSGKQFHHDSVLRGFCQIPLSALAGLDPRACDWLAELA